MWDLIAAVLQGVPSSDPYFLALHEAVRREFPDVDCETRTMCGLDFETNTLFWKAGTDKVPISDYKARLVHSFVRGWKEGRRQWIQLEATL